MQPSINIAAGYPFLLQRRVKFTRWPAGSLPPLSPLCLLLGHAAPDLTPERGHSSPGAPSITFSSLVQYQLAGLTILTTLLQFATIPTPTYTRQSISNFPRYPTQCLRHSAAEYEEEGVGQPEQKEAKCGLHLWSVTKLRITGVGSIRGTGRGRLDSLEHSFHSFPSNLPCPTEHLTQKGVANYLKPPGRVPTLNTVPSLPPLCVLLLCFLLNSFEKPLTLLSWLS